MQLMHQKQTSQSKALENLVGRIPVKEGQKLSKTARPIEKYSKSGKSSFSHARLNLEIAGYWILSKYAQARRNQAKKEKITFP